MYVCNTKSVKNTTKQQQLQVVIQYNWDPEKDSGRAAESAECSWQDIKTVSKGC